MSFSRFQKIALIFFISSFLPSYYIANWRHDVNLAAITEKFEREEKLHLSTDKLLNNCERNEAKENNHYSANHQICEQGLQEHASTSIAMDKLMIEKSQNDVRWFRNFFLSIVILNFLTLLIYKSKAFLSLNK